MPKAGPSPKVKEKSEDKPSSSAEPGKPPKKSTEKETPSIGPNGETIYPLKVPTPWCLSYKIDRKIDSFPESQKILDSYPGSFVTKFPLMGKLDHPLIRY